MPSTFLSTLAAAAILLSTSTSFAQGAPPPPPPPAPPPAPAPAPAPGPYAAPAPGPYYTPPTREPTREGLMVGFGLGVGVLTCDECEDSEVGYGIDFGIGGFVSPQLAILADVMGITVEEGNADLTSVTLAAAAQFWVAEKFWLRGGIGVGRVSLDVNGQEVGESDNELAFVGGAGFEVYGSGTFAIDIRGRLALTKFSNSTLIGYLLGVGFQWN